MKKILIDARMFGTKHTGIGRYVENLLDQISIVNKKYDIYLLINNIDIENKYKTKFKYIHTQIGHYTFSEQLKLPFSIYKYNFELVHFTHFNKPILYFKKSVITIHDLIKNFYFGASTTTRLGPLYWFKYFFYRLFTYINIKNNHIIVPSIFWRDYIIKNYRISDEKIITTYESIDPSFTSKKIVIKPKNYILYTGNLYPHKNIEVILNALIYMPDIKLKIISKPSIFQDRVKKKLKLLKLQKRVIFLGFLADSDFKDLYQNALALVHPSYMEGFSLTGLEAMGLSCPVISSNASCLPEIYKTSVLYFDPNKPLELVDQLNKIKNTETRIDFIKRGHQHIRLFSWEKTAKETLDYYDKILA